MIQDASSPPLAHARGHSRRSAPPWLTALGRRALPQTLYAAGVEYRLAHIYKNDFFAVTARYDAPDGKLILKVNRQARMLGIPMRWVGRMLARHEARVFERLAGIPGIPPFAGRWQDTGILHVFVEGHAMRKGDRVGDEFHAQLRALVDQIHTRDVACVDLEKCENVLVGSDGRPGLVDFQIAFAWPWRWGKDWPPVRWLLRRLQEADRYHLIKLQRRTRRDQLTPSELAGSYRRPWYVHVHGWVFRPFTRVRRAMLARLDPRRGSGERGRVEQEVHSAAPGTAESHRRTP